MGILKPEEHYGFRMGDDRKLARWPAIVAYFDHLAAQSPRIKVDHLGLTTEGRPFISAVITSEANMARLEELRKIHCRLADPRGLSDGEASLLKAEAKSVVMISCSIHASEVGGTQMSSELAYELLTGNDEVTKQVLDNVIFVFVPSLNPDGLEMIAEYYEGTLGKPWEGGPMPWLYHKYVGHDNNRDWFMLTQAENQLAIDAVQNAWHPMIVFDQHQMQPDGFRFFLPPYIDPFDPNVDPLMQHETTLIGSSMIAELLANGKTGITHSIIFDCFSPSRAYQHYHGGIRILSEAASCKIATPIDIPFKAMPTVRDGSDPKVASLAHPIPWAGGTWSLRDIVEYDKIAAWACLKHAARYRDLWVSNFYTISKNGLALDKPFAYVVPVQQSDPITAYEMLATLKRGMVEIHVAKAPFAAEGITYPAGTYVIPLAQPYGRYAKTLLERQTYPDLRQYPGGPPKPPYDITAQTLSLQMGVNCVEVGRPFEAELELVAELTKPVATPAGAVKAMEAEHGYMICPVMNSTFKAVLSLLAAGYEVLRTCDPAGPEGHETAGTFYVPPQDGLADALEALTQEHGLRVRAAPEEQVVDATMMLLRLPRLGMYKSWAATADEGWTRFIFDEYGFPYVSLSDADIKAGGLAHRFDTIILPGQSPAQIAQGMAAGSADPKYTGGLGEPGRAALRDFVAAGGHLICLGPSCDYAVESLGLRIRNSIKALKSEDFYLPGSLLRVMLDTDHPIAYGMRNESVVLAVQSPAYAVEDGDVIGRYPPSGVLQSGWILGEKYIQDQACVVEAPYGEGSVILLAPRVQFRAQTRGAYKLLFNSILFGSSDEVIVE